MKRSKSVFERFSTRRVQCWHPIPQLAFVNVHLCLHVTVAACCATWFGVAHDVSTYIYKSVLDSVQTQRKCLWASKACRGGDAVWQDHDVRSVFRLPNILPLEGVLLVIHYSWWHTDNPLAHWLVPNVCRYGESGEGWWQARFAKLPEPSRRKIWSA